MKILYTYVEGMDPIYIEGTNQTQRVLIVFTDNDKRYVYYCNDATSQVFLNEIISSTLLGFTLSNFKRIEDDEQFNNYIQHIRNNYNYSGEHLEAKIDGHDRGGLVLGRDDDVQT